MSDIKSVASSEKSPVVETVVCETESLQKSVELKIIQNNLNKYLGEAMTSLRNLIPRKKEEGEETISNVWKEFKYPYADKLGPIVRKADSSLDSDVCRIIPFDQARELSEYMKDIVNPHSNSFSFLDCMGGLGHFSMVNVAVLKNIKLHVYDHQNNGNEYGSRNTRMNNVRNNINTVHSSEHKSNAIRPSVHNQVFDYSQAKLNEIIMLDARNMLSQLPNILNDHFDMNEDKTIVLKLPLHYHQVLFDNLMKYPSMRVYGKMIKCSHPRMGMNNELICQYESFQFVILRKTFMRQYHNNNNRKKRDYEHDKRVGNKRYKY